MFCVTSSNLCRAETTRPPHHRTLQDTPLAPLTMRLLNTTTHQLETFHTSQVPLYATLSHRWTACEISFQDLDPGCWEDDSYAKLRNVCALAAADGIDYVWIDTCCIDKTSSAELSEAINSMYRWYRESVICYAYLADVHVPDQDFAKSEWFERGWTLQELIAPSDVVFLDGNWTQIGTKATMHQGISKVTGIPPAVLITGDLSHASAAQKMSWAAKRKTSVTEDRAYCLMGLFGVHMPMIYGEGERAFIRLQEEILKTADDLSLFAWRASDLKGTCGLLASDPSAFEDSETFTRSDPLSVSAIAINNKGINLNVPVVTIKGRGLLALIHAEKEGGREIGIWLEPLSEDGDYFERRSATELLFLDRKGGSIFSKDRVERRICVRQSRRADGHHSSIWRVASQGRVKTMNLLLSHGYSTNFADDSGRTPLSWAAGGGNAEVAELLIRKGAYLEQKDLAGNSPISWAVRCGEHQMVGILAAAGAKVDCSDLEGKSLLMHAAARGHEKVARLLVDMGAAIDATDRNGRTALIHAATQGHAGVAKVLLDGKACPDIAERDRAPALLHAIANRHQEVAKVLLDAGAKTDVRNHQGRSALTLAVMQGQEDIVRRMIDRGADLEDKDHVGATALMRAAASGDLKMAEILMEAGADVRARDVSGWSALELALERGHRDMADRLRKHRGNERETSEDDGAGEASEPAGTTEPASGGVSGMLHRARNSFSLRSSGT